MIETGRVEETKGAADPQVGPTPPPIEAAFAEPPAPPSAAPKKKPAPAKKAPKKKPGRKPAPPAKKHARETPPPIVPEIADDDQEHQEEQPVKPSHAWELEDGIFLGQLGFQLAGTVRGHPDAWKLAAPYDERLGSRLVKVANKYELGARWKDEVMLGVALATAVQVCMLNERVEKARGQLPAPASGNGTHPQQQQSAPQPSIDEVRAVLDRVDGIMARATGGGAPAPA